MPSRCLRLPQALHSDYRWIACVHVGDRHTRGGFDRDRRHFPMRTAATLARKSSTHHMLDTLRQQARRVAAAKWSFDPEVDCGLFPPIALDLVLDDLSLV